MLRSNLIAVALVFLSSSFALGAGPLFAAQTGVKDHPLVSRYQGSEVLDYKFSEFDEFQLPLGKIIDENAFEKVQRLEGKVTKFKYSTPENRSSLEVFRSYQDALQRGGFQILFQCSDADCRAAKSFQGGYRGSAAGIWCFNCEQPMRYLAAKLPRPAGDVYVSLVVEKDRYEGGTWVTIVEVKPMQTGMVTVGAKEMAEDISKTGHASIYGIYFDTDKSVIKPESKQAIDEIAKLLKAQPSLRLHVVGHTDNVGALPHNMTLSKQRAGAVVNALVTNYQIAASRLIANGVGPLAPVASNDAEDGRAKNRRVELVAQ
jgi:OmpA-OmpF porin, OOP family